MTNCVHAYTEGTISPEGLEDVHSHYIQTYYTLSKSDEYVWRFLCAHTHSCSMPSTPSIHQATTVIKTENKE